MSNLKTFPTEAKAIRAAIDLGLTGEEAVTVISQPSASMTYQLDLDAAERVLVARKSAHHRTVETPHERATLIENDQDLDLIQAAGYSHCPHCGIGLDNGLCDFDGLVDIHGEKAARGMQKHEWACMACGGEWGALVVSKRGGSTSPKRHYENKSSVEGAVVVSWDIFAADPTMRRKDAIQKAVDAGVAFYTARTQYQKWFKAGGKNVK